MASNKNKVEKQGNRTSAGPYQCSCLKLHFTANRAQTNQSQRHALEQQAQEESAALSDRRLVKQ
eukprot:1158847-Pelagomonas_calceolata.AAC.5